VLFESLCQIQDPLPHSASLNMAVDEALLRNAQEPTLRIYRWERPSVSFGYFSKASEIATSWPGHERVRRWTGGGTVLHGNDLTYTLVVPRSYAFARSSAAESYFKIHALIAKLLSPDSALAPEAPPKVSEACFENPARHDILLGGRKIGGAAQRRTALGLLHQGSIQVEARLHEDLTAKLGKAFAQHVTNRALSAAEWEQSLQLAAQRYGTQEWLWKF
jgi:lipoyl(octanoyl) transferase